MSTTLSNPSFSVHSYPPYLPLLSASRLAALAEYARAHTQACVPPWPYLNKNRIKFLPVRSLVAEK